MDYLIREMYVGTLLSARQCSRPHWENNEWATVPDGKGTTFEGRLRKVNSEQISIYEYTWQVVMLFNTVKQSGVKEIKTELSGSPLKLKDIWDIGNLLLEIWTVWLSVGKEFQTEGTASSMCFQKRMRGCWVTNAKIWGIWFQTGSGPPGNVEPDKLLHFTLKEKKYVTEGFWAGVWHVVTEHFLRITLVSGCLNRWMRYSQKQEIQKESFFNNSGERWWWFRLGW